MSYLDYSLEKLIELERQLTEYKTLLEKTGRLLNSADIDRAIQVISHDIARQQAKKGRQEDGVVKVSVTLTSSGLHCPRCGIGEVNPKDNRLVCIRAYKVTNQGKSYSQCLVCSGYYNNATDLVRQPDNHNPEKGWFETSC